MEFVRALLDAIRSQGANHPDCAPALRSLTECAARLLGVDRAGVWCLDPPPVQLEARGAEALLCLDEYVAADANHVSGARLPLAVHAGYLAVLQRHETILAHDVQRHPATRSLVETQLRDLGVSASLDVPIIVAGQILGVLRLMQTGSRRRWRADEVLLAQALATGAALLCERSERHRVDQELKLSEEQLRLALQSTEDGLWDWDILSGAMRSSSLLWSRMLGYGPGEIAPLVDAYADLIHADDGPGVRQRFADHVQGLASEFHSVHRMLHKSGRWIWVRSRGKIVARAPDGTPLRMVGTNVDITEHKRVEEELRSKNALLDAIRDAQDRFIVAPDMKATFERMLSTVLRLTQSEYGFIAEVMRDDQGRPVPKAHAITNIAWDASTLSFHEPKAPMGPVFSNLGTLFGAVMTSGRPVLTNGPADPPWRDGNLSGHPPLRAFMGLPFFHQGEMLGVVGVANRPGGYSAEAAEELAPFLLTCASLTAAVRERQRSRVAEEERDRFFEMAVDPLCILDSGGMSRRVNAAFAQRLGYTPSEISGRPFLDFVHADDRAATGSVLQALGSGSTRVRFEIRCLCRDGTTRWLSWNATAAEQGVVYAIARDITEQRQAEEERQRLTEQLIQAQKMEAVGRLAGGIAHDFNNILTTIQGCGSLLQQSLYRHPDAELADEILAASERAAVLTRQLLAFSRKQLLSPMLLDLGKVVGSMRGMLQQLLGDQIKLRILVAPGLGLVRVDPSRIEQVIVNLTVNAREMMSTGGELRIVVRGLPLPDAPDGTSPETGAPCGEVELVFADNGQSLNEETRAHLFEPFFATKGSGRSSGLGLATVYGIVTQSGGRISVESVQGGGTSFRIVFPTSTHAGGAPSTTRARGEHVLVVEDDKAVREMLIFTLRALDYQVFAAVDGLDAIELQDRTGLQPDLLLTDVIMPNLGGPDLARHMQQRQPGLRVLFMTGFSGDAELQRGLAEGSFAILGKPFMPNQLARAVRALLDLPR